MTLGDRREPPADIKCPSAAQRKQAKRACMYIYIYKRASLACAARLADTLCPPEAPFGLLEVTLVNYKGDIIPKYVHLSFKIEITRKITRFVNFKILKRNDDVITK